MTGSSRPAEPWPGRDARQLLPCAGVGGQGGWKCSVKLALCNGRKRAGRGAPGPQVGRWAASCVHTHRGAATRVPVTELQRPQQARHELEALL